MAKRKTKIAAIVEKYVRALESDIHISKIVLFGSQARGVADKQSDIDLAVISPDFAKRNHLDNFKLLIMKKIGVDLSIEALPYTPSEWNNADPRSFIAAIKKSGKVMYKS